MVKVTVISLAYNQEKFIRQALDGFVAQQTDFSFEVLVHDDASTDGTTQIIEEYAQKYPDIIKPILETENQYSKGTFKFVNDMMRSAEGEYIAFCEGDDYWTDDHKLQIQADFLDKHKDYAVCFHPVKVIFEGNAQEPYSFPEIEPDMKFTTKTLLRSNYIQTNSVMYRRQSYADLPEGILPQDWYMHLYHAKFGKIGFIDKTMAIYRRHAGGIWWEAAGHIEIVWGKYGMQHLALYIALLQLYGENKEYREILLADVGSLFDVLSLLDPENKKRLLVRMSEAIPDAFEHYIASKNLRLQRTEIAANEANIQAEELRQAIQANERELQKKEQLLQHKDKEISDIIHSKSWRVTKPLRSMRRTSKKLRSAADKKDSNTRFTKSS